MVLQSGAVLLRPWQVEEARWYVEARDEEVFQWTTERRTLTVAEAEDAIAKANGLGLFCFAIFDLERQELAGNLALVRDTDDPQCAEVMYWLAPQGRGRGLAGQAVRLVCQWAFASQSLERVTLQMHPDNVRSRRLAERLGFRWLPNPRASAAQMERVWFGLNRGVDVASLR